MRVRYYICLVLMGLFALAVPVWSYSAAWGDRPSEFIGAALIFVLLSMLLSRGQS